MHTLQNIEGIRAETRSQTLLMAQENMENEMGLRPMRLNNGLRDSDRDWWGWLRFGTIVCKSPNYG